MELEDLIPHEPELTSDGEYIAPPGEYKFTTGAAGTGKTFKVREAINADPNYGILAATTGIAAVNLGCTTLNSVLKFFDTDSLRDRFNRGSLSATLHRLGKKIKRLVIDEVSMMDSRQLDYIFQAMRIVNQYQDMEDAPMGILLTGDFLQLPPVKAEYVFKADCWEHFHRNTEILTKIWRQDNPEYVEALNAARVGRGVEAAEILKRMGVRFVPNTLPTFKGTTILSKNVQVDNFNFAQLLDIPGPGFIMKPMMWGEQSGEWKNIPGATGNPNEALKLKDGAYVMILANDSESGMFEYANGDCGVVQGKDDKGTVWVKLVRNEKLVAINPIIRYKVVSHDDGEKMGLKASDPGNTKTGDGLGFINSIERPRMPHLYCDKDCGWDLAGRKHGQWGYPSYNCQSGTFNVGAIKFYPLRLAYATSVHKSQGLTLDTCQIDCRDPFFGEPGMAYVALSRCRTPQGLTIVGSPDKLAERIKLDPRVINYV